MISSYDFVLSSKNGAPITSDCAYKLYSWLLSQITEEQGDALHTQEDHPVSQYISFDKFNGRILWHVSLLNSAAHELFAPVLDKTESANLHTGVLDVVEKSHSPEKEIRDIILEGRNYSPNRTVIQFCSPTSFKQNCKYVIYPQEKLIIQSLINRWNSFCPEFSLADEDALAMLENGISISDYSLHTVRFRLKNTFIPGFCGKITLTARLSPALMELWASLLQWSVYSGIGIKTSLGMGGVKIVR